MEVDVNAMQPWMGVPSSRAVLADMRMWMPVPWNSRKPVQVVVAGPDVSVGSRPIANSVSLLLVGTPLTDVVEATRNHHFGLSGQQGTTSNPDRLQSSCTTESHQSM